MKQSDRSLAKVKVQIIEISDKRCGGPIELDSISYRLVLLCFYE